MKKRVIWPDAAKRDVRAIDREPALRILNGIDRFMSTGEGDVKQLTAVEPTEFRLRIGDYRIRFYDHGAAIEILAVKHRREAYR